MSTVAQEIDLIGSIYKGLLERHNATVASAPQKAMALSDPAFESLPVKREMVFPLGEPVGNDARTWRFTKADLQNVVTEFGKRPDKYMVVNYEHGKDPKHGLEAAGWIDHLEVAPDGLYAHIRYTDEALGEIQQGKWGYRSPEWDAVQYPDGAWGAQRLAKLSITNDPAIGGMPPIQASTTTAPPGAPTAATNGAQEEHAMEVPQTVTAAKQKGAAFDKAGLIALIRDTYAMPDAVSDEMLIELVGKALMGAPEEPGMPEAGTETPAPIPPELANASAKPPEAKPDFKRVVAAVQRAASLGNVTRATLAEAGKLAAADVESFERLFCSPPAPAAGQLITASAKDRSVKPMSYADTIRAQRNAAIGAARQ